MESGNQLQGAISAVARHRVAGPAVIAAGIAAVSTVVWFADPTTPGGLIPPCPTNALLHINCPGCGSSRALYSLLHGDLPAALHYNAFGVVAVVLLLIAFATYTIGLWRGRPVRSWQNWRYTPMVALVATVIWFVIRNLPFAPFSALKV